MAWLSKTKVPGRDLPEDSLWQVHETGTMTEEDYDFVIDKGWNAFMGECLFNRGIADLADLKESDELTSEFVNKYKEEGIEPLTVFSCTPFEHFCGARSMPKFFRDLHRIPDKVQAAMDAMMPDILDRVRNEIRQKKNTTAQNK
jgi:uroporphyrinogen decarboxylase